MICKLYNWPYGEIWQPDRNNEFMIWTGYWSENADYFEKFSKYSSLHKFARGIGLIGKTWQKKELLWLKDVSETNDFLRSDLMHNNGLNHAICFPLVNENKVRCLTCFFLENLADNDLENAKILSQYPEKIGEQISRLT